MIIVRLLSPGPWLVRSTKVYPGVGADIVMESITLTTPASARLCAVGACNPKTDPVSLATKDGETFEDVEIFF